MFSASEQDLRSNALIVDVAGALEGRARAVDALGCEHMRRC
jgi:hypothetical protein